MNFLNILDDLDDNLDNSWNSNKINFGSERYLIGSGVGVPKSYTVKKITSF